MGIFDFLRGGGGKSNPPPGPALDRKVAGPAKVVANKQAQTYDRLEAIQALCEMKTADAAAALLKRFSYSIDPSITDQEEKELCYQGIVDAGEAAVPKVLEYCEKETNLTWPIKVLRELLEDDDYRDELVEMLGRFDTEYQRNVEPKLQILQALEDIVAEEVRTAVEPFLEDVNETVRFHAVQTTFAQGNAESVPALVKLLAAEESVRIKNKVADLMIFRGWAIPSELREKTNEALRDAGGYGVGADGRIQKRSSFV